MTDQTRPAEWDRIRHNPRACHGEPPPLSNPLFGWYWVEINRIPGSTPDILAGHRLGLTPRTPLPRTLNPQVSGSNPGAPDLRIKCIGVLGPSPAELSFGGRDLTRHSSMRSPGSWCALRRRGVRSTPGISQEAALRTHPTSRATPSYSRCSGRGGTIGFLSSTRRPAPEPALRQLLPT